MLEVLGIVNNQYLFSISEAVFEESAGKAIKIVDEVAAGGKDISQLIKRFTDAYRNLLMAKVVSNCEDVVDMSREGIEQQKAISNYDKNNIIRCINYYLSLKVKQNGQSTQGFCWRLHW